MKRCAFLLLAALITGAGCGKSPQGQGKVVVATSIPVLADFVRQVGQDKVEVVNIVAGAANPHNFEITPETIHRASRARLLVLNGLGLEFWAPKLVDAIGKKSIKVIDTSAGIQPIEEDDENGHGHGHSGANPHIWLSPPLAIHQVEAIRDALAEIDPGNASHYRRNSQAYIDSLHALDNEITLEIAGWLQRSFICFHPSWNYFADNYKLNQAAVVEKRSGFEPTPREIVEIIELVKKLGISAIFAERQFPTQSSETIARECGARVISLDPLGEESPRFSYLSLMRRNVAKMAQAMK